MRDADHIASPERTRECSANMVSRSGEISTVLGLNATQELVIGAILGPKECGLRHFAQQVAQAVVVAFAIRLEAEKRRPVPLVAPDHQRDHDECDPTELAAD